MTPKPPETLETLDDAERIFCALSLMPVPDRASSLNIQAIVNELHVWLAGPGWGEEQLRAKLLQQQLLELSWKLGGDAMTLPPTSAPADGPTLAAGILSHHFEGLIPHPDLVLAFEQDHPSLLEPGAVFMRSTDRIAAWLRLNRVAGLPWLQLPPEDGSPRLGHLVTQFEARLREIHGVSDWPISD